MPLTLYDATVPQWLQILGSVDTLLDKAAVLCTEEGISEGRLLETRLADDMLPLGYQFKSCWTHSKLALDGVHAGQFSPDMTPYPTTLDGCRAKIAEAIAACEAADADALEGIAANPMVFSIKDRFRLDFTVQNFLLSFSLPNFYFHATTAYDILRMKGVEIGKQNFLGQLRLAQA